MEEKDMSSGGGAPLGKPSAKERIENFWYHYKWHSIVAVFVIIAILVCSLQMCSKDSYDVYILYAGDHEIKRTAEGGSVPEYQRMLTALERVTPDHDGDGKITVGFNSLLALSAE